MPPPLAWKPKTAQSPQQVLSASSKRMLHSSRIFKRILSYVDAHPGNLPREAAMWGLVILGHRCPIIFADIHEIVSGEEERHCARKACFAYLVAIDGQRAEPTLANPTAVISELVTNGVLTRRQCLSGARIDVLDAEVAVAMRRHPAFEVKAPAAKAPSLNNNCAARFVVGHHEFRR